MTVRGITRAVVLLALSALVVACGPPKQDSAVVPDETEILRFRAYLEAREAAQHAARVWRDAFDASWSVLRPPSFPAQPDLDVPWHPEPPPNHPWRRASETERKEAIEAAARLDEALDLARRDLEAAREALGRSLSLAAERSTWTAVLGQSDELYWVWEGGGADGVVEVLLDPEDRVEPGHRFLVTRSGQYVSAIEITAIAETPARLRKKIDPDVRLRTAKATIVPRLHAGDIKEGDMLIPWQGLDHERYE